MRKILLASIFPFSIILIIFNSCEKNNVPLIFDDDFLQNLGKILQRSFYYDEEILNSYGVDLNDVKNTYSYQEMLNIIAKSNNVSEMAKHKNVLIDDDLIYVNVYNYT